MDLNGFKQINITKLKYGSIDIFIYINYIIYFFCYRKRKIVNYLIIQ
mgnify:CR=1 FL=1